MDALRKVARASTNRVRAERAWRDAILAARDEGISLRQVATAAGVTHPRIAQIVHEECDET